MPCGASTRSSAGAAFFRPHGAPNGEKNILWFNPDGLEMSDTEWHQGFARTASACISLGDAIGEVDAAGEPVRDANFLLLINAYHEAVPFQIPGTVTNAGKWRSTPTIKRTAKRRSYARHYARGCVFLLPGRSLVLLQQSSPTPA